MQVQVQVQVQPFVLLPSAKLHSQAAKQCGPETESDVVEWNAVRCISTPPEKETQ
jgi:hypothetical protein